MQSREIQRLQDITSHYRNWAAQLQARYETFAPDAARAAKRIYIGNLPAKITEAELRQGINNIMVKYGGSCMAGFPITLCKLYPMTCMIALEAVCLLEKSVFFAPIANFTFPHISPPFTGFHLQGQQHVIHVPTSAAQSTIHVSSVSRIPSKSKSGGTTPDPGATVDAFENPPRVSGAATPSTRSVLASKACTPALLRPSSQGSDTRRSALPRATTPLPPPHMAPSSRPSSASAATSAAAAAPDTAMASPSLEPENFVEAPPPVHSSPKYMTPHSTGSVGAALGPMQASMIPFPTVSVTVQDKSYAFVEFRSVEEASNCMALDGVRFMDTFLKVRRPNNYDASVAICMGPTEPNPAMDLYSLGVVRTVVQDSPHKLFIGGLPCDWTEDQVKEMLVPFGILRAFNLVMDRATGNSKGYAFCELADVAATDAIIQSIHGKPVGNKFLTVKRAEASTPSPPGQP